MGLLIILTTLTLIVGVVYLLPYSPKVGDKVKVIEYEEGSVYEYLGLVVEANKDYFVIEGFLLINVAGEQRVADKTDYKFYYSENVKIGKI
jgi:hypothetical protein